MADIIKTWPACVDAKTVARIFRPHLFYEGGFCQYFFTLGRGKPQQKIDRLWFTYKGRILGSFAVAEVVINDGSLPRLARLDGGESDWQIKPDRWVAICEEDCTPAPDRLYMGGFRGWRYFSFDDYAKSSESRMRL